VTQATTTTLKRAAVYRFSKGTYRLIGLGAGASQLSWGWVPLLDSLGAVA
jgi:hypothetical protein